MNKACKTIMGVAAATAVVASSCAPAAVSAWGDNAGGRPSYNYSEGFYSETPVLNSFNYDAENNVTDEFNFVSAKATSASNQSWQYDNITVEDNTEYVVKLYVHNDVEGTTAEDLTARFAIANTSDYSASVTGFLNSSNATPTEYYDNVVFSADQKFHLNYVEGSATLINSGRLNGSVLSDQIIEDGVLIGYDEAGKLPGCFQYVTYVEIKVVAHYDNSLEKTVRLEGATDWSENVTAKVGDKVEFQIAYVNNSDETVSDVMVKDFLPENLKYVEGSTKIKNANHKSGAVLTDAEGNITTTGINIGSYEAGAKAYIIFTAEVVADDEKCGAQTLTNWANVTVNGEVVDKDSASVNTTFVCADIPEEEPETPERIVETGASTVMVAAAVLAGVVTTGAGYVIAGRKN